MVQSATGDRTPAFAQDALYDRIYAVNAVVAIANSMGDLTEMMSWRQVEETYGFLDQLLPQEVSERRRKSDWGPDFHYKAHARPAGMGEDGQERHRLMCEAIIRKGGRVNVWDIARIWVELIDPEKFGILLGPQDQVIYWSLRAGVPPTEVGRYATFPAFHGTTKMMLPVGLVNACNPKQAALDARDCGRIKDTPGTNGSHATGNYALDVAAGMAAGIAAAMLPNATVSSTIDTALAELSTPARTEVEIGLGWAKEHGDWKVLRELYEERYRGRPISNAVEVLSSALAVFYLADGDLEKSLLWSVNFGRDTDDRAADAGGLAAALNGSAGLRQEWLDTIDAAIVGDQWTVSRRSLADAARGLYDATLNAVEEARQHVRAVEELLGR